jgi:NAD-dependent DNA ligase
LKFFPYGIELDEKDEAHWKLSTQVDKLNLIKRLGFPNCEKYEIVSGILINDVIKFLVQFLVNEIGEIMKKLKEWEKKRSSLEFDIDGMVLKVNSLELQSKMGETSKFPKYAD